jgi:hypothetical protein
MWGRSKSKIVKRTAPGARQPVESAELHAVLASDFHGQRSMNRCSSAASRPAAAGAAMRRGAGTGNSPERVPIQSGFGVITGREGRRMARMRKMRFAGPGRPRTAPRCPCGATTIRRGQGTSGC